MLRAAIIPLVVSLSLVGLTAAHAGRGKGKKLKTHRYHGGHPLSVKPDDGYCYIEVPHVHTASISPRHKALYREHDRDMVFIADPAAYGYEGPRHSYYGHHPVAVDVVLGSQNSFASGQQLEFCYLDGPHYHVYGPQPGLSFEQAAGASWYIGEFPEAYVEGKVTYAPANRVYATIDVERPEVVFEEPPVGYVGPLLDIHVHAPGAAVVVEPAHVDVGIHGHGRGNGHAEVRAGVEVHIPAPTLQIGVGFGVDDHHRHHKGRKVKVKGRHKKHSKHKRKGRARPRW